MNDTRFIELSARDRAKGLLDASTFRELLGPFDFIMSPWLPPQGIVPQADDGMVVAKGTIDGKPAVVIAIEGTFQGGSMGEVSGAKMAAALEMAAEDNRKGIPTQAILCLETGGVRLQEANLGLAAIADIHAAIVDLRRYVPVIGIIAGTVGCFGGKRLRDALVGVVILRKGRLPCGQRGIGARRGDREHGEYGEAEHDDEREDADGPHAHRSGGRRLAPAGYHAASSRDALAAT